MSDRSGKRKRITEAELASTMRQMPKIPSYFSRPDDIIITRYLLCEASESERAIIEEAMLNSTTFRREILLLAKDIDSLSEVRVDSDAIARITAPERQSFIETFAARSVKSGFWENVLGLFERLLIPQVYIPAVVAAATVIIVFLLTTKQSPNLYVASNIEWRLEEAGLDHNLLRSKEARGDSRPVISEAIISARTAALSEIRELLTYANGVFELIPATESPRPPDKSVLHILRITDSNSQYSRAFSTFVPQDTDIVDTSVTAWLLTLPSLSLYQVELQSKTVTIAWPSEIDDYGCMTVTYRDIDGFHVLRGHTVDLRD